MEIIANNAQINQFDKIAPWMLVCASVLVLTALGTFRLFDGGGINLTDFACLHGGGAMWLVGENPYLHGAGPSKASFAYPPTSAVFFMFFGFMPYGVSKFLYIFSNYLALAGVIHLAFKNFIPDFSWSRLKLGDALAVSVLIASPPLGVVFALGQTSILFLFFALLCWHYYRNENILPAAFFLALATMKPQFSLFLIVWFIFNLRIKLLLLGGLFGIALLAPLLVWFTPVDIFRDWLAAMNHYQSYNFNQWGFQDVVGIQSLLAAAGVHSVTLAPVGFLLLAALFFYRDRFGDEWLFSLFMILSFSFLFVHDYDYSGLIPAWLGAIIFASKNPRWIAPIVLLIIFFHIPQVIPRRLFNIGYTELNPVMQWRTVLVIVLGGLIVFWNLIRRQK